jgi:hypothetical protein
MKSLRVTKLVIVDNGYDDDDDDDVAVGIFGGAESFCATITSF